MDAETATSVPVTAERDQSWRLVALLAIIYTCAFVDRSVLALLVDPIKADLGISDVSMSLLLGVAFSLFYAVLNIPAGLLIDRVGRRDLIAGAAIGWSLMTIVCGLAGSFWQLFAGRAGLGLAEAFITPASFALIRDRVPALKRGRAFSVMAMAPQVGGSLALIGGGALIAGADAGRFDDWVFIGGLKHWQMVLALIGVAGLPLAGLMLLIRPDRRARATAGTGTGGLKHAWAHMVSNGRTYALLIGYVVAGSMLAFGKSAWTPAMMARKFSLPLSSVGLISGQITLVSAIAGLITCGFVIDRMAAKGGETVRYGILAAGISTIASILSPLVPDQTAAWALYGLSIFFVGAFYSIGATILARITPSAMMGKITGIYLLLQNVIGSAAGPTLVALIAQTFFTGPRAIAFALSIYCAITGLAALLLLLGLTRAVRPAIPSR